MRTILVIALAGLLLTFASCGRSASDDRRDTLSVAATIPPLAWIARGLAPDGSNVTTLLPPGASEHGYEPPPSRLADFVRADVVLMVGLGLEPAADRSLRTQPRGGRAVVVFAEAAQTTGSPNANHNHSEHDHAHGTDAADRDPHLWLDPPLMLLMVDASRDAIARLLARRNASEQDVAALDARRDALADAVRRVDKAYRDRLAPFAGAAIVSAHDSMRPLASRYSLQIVGVVHAHEGAEPTPGEMVRAAQGLRNATHRVILIEPQSGRSLADRLAEETGAPVATFDPLGSGDWEATMLANLDALAEALERSNR